MRYRGPVGVSVLTNGSRLGRLQACLGSLLEHCYYRPLVVGVFDNGSVDGTAAFLRALPTVYGVEWRVKTVERDIGCAPGTNAAMDLVGDCEYALHVESDFVHLCESDSGVGRMWLHEAVEFLEEGDCDYLYLRRMRTVEEVYMHFWAQWMPQVTEVRADYLCCPAFWFSQNPHLRRDSSLRKAGTLPLREFYGPHGETVDVKGTPFWNKAEMEAPSPPRPWLHRWGMFAHEVEARRLYDRASGCGRSSHGASTCKYGLFQCPALSQWCRCCDARKDFRDMQEHANRHRAMCGG